MAKVTGNVMELGRVRIRKDYGEYLLTILSDPKNPERLGKGALKTYLERLIARDMKERKKEVSSVLDNLDLGV